jgi:type IV secretion system protein TrbL
MLVIYLIAGVVVTYIPSFQAALTNGGITNITPLLVMVGAAFLISFLAWKAPTIASAIMNGTTSVNSSDMASFGMSMAAAGAAAAAGTVGAAQGAASVAKGAAGMAGKGIDVAKSLFGGLGGGAGSISAAGGGGGMNRDSLGGMPGGNASSSGKPSATDSQRAASELLGGFGGGNVPVNPSFDNSDFGSGSGSGDASSASIGEQASGGNGSAPAGGEKKPSFASRAAEATKSMAQDTQRRADKVKDWIPDAQNGGTLHIDHKG